MTCIQIHTCHSTVRDIGHCLKHPETIHIKRAKHFVTQASSTSLDVESSRSLATNLGFPTPNHFNKSNKKAKGMRARHDSISRNVQVQVNQLALFYGRNVPEWWATKDPYNGSWNNPDNWEVFRPQKNHKQPGPHPFFIARVTLRAPSSHRPTPPPGFPEKLVWSRRWSTGISANIFWSSSDSAVLDRNKNNITVSKIPPENNGFFICLMVFRIMVVKLLWY